MPQQASSKCRDAGRGRGQPAVARLCCAATRLRAARDQHIARLPPPPALRTAGATVLHTTPRSMRFLEPTCGRALLTRPPTHTADVTRKKRHAACSTNLRVARDAHDARLPHVQLGLVHGSHLKEGWRVGCGGWSASTRRCTGECADSSEVRPQHGSSAEQTAAAVTTAALTPPNPAHSLGRQH